MGPSNVADFFCRLYDFCIQNIMYIYIFYEPWWKKLERSWWNVLPLGNICTMIWRTSVWEARTSRYHWDVIEGPGKITQSSHGTWSNIIWSHGTEGFEIGTSLLTPTTKFPVSYREIQRGSDFPEPIRFNVPSFALYLWGSVTLYIS